MTQILQAALLVLFFFHGVTVNAQSDIVGVLNSEPSTISSLENASTISSNTDGVAVWEFTIRDGGMLTDLDNLPTIVTALNITQGSANTAANWQNFIEDAALFDDAGKLVANATINSASLSFSSLKITVADNTSEKIQLRLSLKKSGIEDNSVFQFVVTNRSVSVDRNTKSSQLATFSALSNLLHNKVSVTASVLKYIVQPVSTEVGKTMSPSVVVRATDANGNTDKDFSNTISLQLSKGAFGALATTSAIPILGEASFLLVFDDPVTSTEITASATGVSAVTSNSFDVPLPASLHVYRTKSSGDWADAATWEFSVDGGVNWKLALSVPDLNIGAIYIADGHTIEVSKHDVTIDQTVIEKGGTLIWKNYMITVNNGPGTDLLIKGKFVHDYLKYSNFVYKSAAGGLDPEIIVAKDGIVEISPNAPGASINFAADNSRIKYETGAIFLWNNLAGFQTQDKTYFLGASDTTIAIFRVNTTISVGAGGNTTVNGVFEVTSGNSVTWTGSGTKYFRNGIIGEGNVVQDITSGPFVINGVAQLAGKGNIELNVGGLRTTNTSYVSLITDKEIRKTKGKGDVLVAGTINAKTNGLKGNANFELANNATLITAGDSGVNKSIKLKGNNKFRKANYIFDGTIDQLTGSMLSDSAKKIIIKNGRKVKLNKNVVVTDSLVIEDGTLYTDSAKIILSRTAYLKESKGKYVIGEIETKRPMKSTNQEEAFGNIGLVISTQAAAPDSLYVKRITGEKGERKFGGIQSIARTFVIRSVNKSDLGATMKFYYYDDEVNGLPENDFNLYRSPDSSKTWEKKGYTNLDVDANVIELTGISQFSDWTTGSYVAPLPVEMISFKAALQPDNKRITLNWETASEINNSHFEVERSVDGEHWIKLNTVQGNGTTYFNSIYEYTDRNFYAARSKVLYYRLKQVDYNGTYEYSDVKRVLIPAYNNTQVSTWYNNSDGNIHLQFNDIKGQLRVQVINPHGQELTGCSYILDGNHTRAQINAASLTPGTYYCIITTEGQVISKPVMISNKLR